MSDIIIHEPIQEVITSIELVNAKFLTVHQRAIEALQDGYAVELSCKPIKSTRSVQANACMWAHLADIARQVIWHGSKLSSDEWKEILSAGLKQQRAVPGIEGGFVVLGVRTSKMSIKEMAAMIDLCIAFGTQQGVKFTVPAWRDEAQPIRS